MAMAARIFRAVLESRFHQLSGNFNQIITTTAAARLSTSSVFYAKKFTDKHEWVDVSGKIGTIGITEYAQDSLGDIVYAQLPDVDTEFAIMDECGALESVKAASELYCPVTGKVTEKNTAVEETPGLINKSCYDKGWLFKIELQKPEELDSLMDEATYKNFLKDQVEGQN